MCGHEVPVRLRRREPLQGDHLRQADGRHERPSSARARSSIIKKVDDGSVTLTAGGAGATLKAGESKQVGRFKITVDSVKDGDVTMHVEEA